MEEIKVGRYKARAVVGSEQYGETNSGNLQIAIDMTIPTLQRTMTTFLFFTPDAESWSYDRLRACGWKGKGPEDLMNLAGIGDLDVEVDVTSEMYDGKLQLRCQIVTGSGKVTLQKPVAKDSFVARLKMLTGSGSGGGGGSSGSGGGGKKDDEIPF